MAYATEEDMKARCGDKEIESLVAALGANAVAIALADAAAEIDGYLSRQYTLPLDAAARAPMLVWISCDIARYRLWIDKVNDETDTVYVRYKRAVKVLEDIAAGRAALVDGGGGAYTDGSPEARIRSDRRKVFTNSVLSRMNYGDC
jgi:phage gp36-like protein